jgi:excisionase family DNA binding protein
MALRSELITTGDRRTLIPSPGDSALAQQESSRMLEVTRNMKNKSVESLLGQFQIEKKPLKLNIPVAAMQMLIEIMQQMAQGKPVSIIPSNAELTTQQAADFLSISRPYFVKLLEEGKMPFKKVGARRRVLFKDLIEFKTIDLERRNKVADNLVGLSQEIANDFGENY